MKINKTKKIAYIQYVNLPSKHAHSINIIEMCHSLGKICNVDLIVPFFATHRVYQKDVFEYYGIKKNFGIKRIYVPDFFFLSKYFPKLAPLFFHIHNILFSIASFFYVMISSKKYHVVYTRNPYIAFIFSFFKPVIYDIHALHFHGIYFILERFSLKKIKLLIFSTPYFKYLYKKKYGLVSNMLTLPNGVNISKITAISHKPLKNHKPTIGYIGSVETIGSSKGIEVILDAAKEVKNVIFYIIGFKTDEEYKRYKKIVESKNLKNVVLMKRVPHREAISWMKSFDILLVPLPWTLFNAYFTSPIKLFEYMAVKKCIIASDLPSIRSIVSDKEVLFFKAGDAKDLANKIKYALTHKKECKEKAQRAYDKVIKEYTWDERAKRVFKRVVEIV